MHKRFLFVPSLTVRLLVALVDYNPERELLGLLLTDLVSEFASRPRITGFLGAPYTKRPRGDLLAALVCRVYPPDELSRLPRTNGTLGDCSQQHEATTRPSIARLAPCHNPRERSRSTYANGGLRAFNQYASGPYGMVFLKTAGALPLDLLFSETTQIGAD